MAAETIRRGMSGRVTASHTTAMHSYNAAYAYRLINNIARAGLHMVTNPLDNAVLQGRFDTGPIRRGHTRVKQLAEAGVNVCIGHDSVMDPWYPLGYGDPLQAAFVLAHYGHMTGDAELRALLEMITRQPGRGAGRPGLRPAAGRPGRPGGLRRPVGGRRAAPGGAADPGAARRAGGGPVDAGPHHGDLARRRGAGHLPARLTGDPGRSRAQAPASAARPAGLLLLSARRERRPVLAGRIRVVRATRILRANGLAGARYPRRARPVLAGDDQHLLAAAVALQPEEQRSTARRRARSRPRR